MNADGESIRARREALGVSIQDLARLSGIGRDTLSDTELSRKDFRRLTLAKADRALRALEAETGGAPFQAVADRVAARRGAIGISQEVLANEARINRDTVGAIESGSGFRPSSLRKTEAALSRLEAKAGITTPAVTVPAAPPDLIEFDIRAEDFGVHLVVKGPVADAELLKRQVVDIIREIRR